MNSVEMGTCLDWGSFRLTITFKAFSSSVGAQAYRHTHVGLEERMNNFPAQLSGGEQQRVAIARALAKNPKLLLCDEPTGALDYETGKAILKLLQDCSRKRGMTVVIITHNQALTAMADRIIKVKSGKIASVKMNEQIVPVEEIEW